MSLKDQITEDMKNAMRAKDTARLGTIRLLLAAMKQKEVDERIELDDGAVVAKAVAEVGATGPQDMGKVIGLVKSQLAGKADMGVVSALVKVALTK